MKPERAPGPTIDKVDFLLHFDERNGKTLEKITVSHAATAYTLILANSVLCTLAGVGPCDVLIAGKEGRSRPTAEWPNFSTSWGVICLRRVIARSDC